MNKKLFLLGISLAVAGITQAQTSGGITPQMLQQMEKQQAQQPMSRGLFNAIAQNNIDDLAKNFQNQGDIDTHFSIETPKQSIHDQKSSGRCWMFSGLNVLARTSPSSMRTHLPWSSHTTTCSSTTNWKRPT